MIHDFTTSHVCVNTPINITIIIIIFIIIVFNYCISNLNWMPFWYTYQYCIKKWLPKLSRTTSSRIKDSDPLHFSWEAERIINPYTHYIVIMLTSVLHFATRRIIFNIIYLYIKLYNFLLGEICNVRCPDYTYITFYSCTVP